jgi:protein TonB
MSNVAYPPARGLSSLIFRTREAMRGRFGRRAAGMAAALAIEGVLLLALLSLGIVKPLRNVVPIAIDSFDVRNEAKEPPQPEQSRKQSAAAASSARAQRVEAPSPPHPAPVAPPRPQTVIELSPQTQSFDLSKIAKAPPAARPSTGLIGPVDTPRFGDSERVGTAPNGAPMYAARWYREPTDQELRGYLSTAQAPAWGLITCKTVADFRVEDCVGLDEYPEGSRMLPAILAAAWQFRVRPPQIGGVPQVGDWVRIRIDYDYKPAGSSYGAAR